MDSDGTFLERGVFTASQTHYFPQHGLVDTPDFGRLFCPAVPTAELSTSLRPAKGVASRGERSVVATKREKRDTTRLIRQKSCPTLLELQIRRLRWWQSILLDREGNEALLGLFIGRLGAEVEGPLLDNGNLSPNAHPWALQLKADLPSILFDHEEGTDQPHGESTWFLRPRAARGDYKRIPLVSSNFLHTTGRSASRVFVISARFLPRRRKPCTN